jgi:CDGSH-type Zn-finger protein
MKVTLTTNHTEVLLDPGDIVTLCRCGDSDKWPLCDGAHKHLVGHVPQCTPAIVSAVPEPETEISGSHGVLVVDLETEP